MEITPAIFVAIVAVTFLCGYMDVSLGMGYGSTLTPLLLIAGFLPLHVVPSVLLGQLAGGMVGGLSHHKFGNIRLDFRRDEELLKRRLRGLGYIPRSPDAKVVFVLSICGIVGAIVAVFFAINIPRIALETYIGGMILIIGLIILIRRNREFTFSWKGLIGIGLISAFNKGASGGGYGPLVTGGQIISGRDAKSSIGSTTLAEAFICVVAFLTYLIVKVDIDWKLASAVCIGSVIASPLAALTTKKLHTENLKFIIGLLITVLGALTLIRTYVFS